MINREKKKFPRNTLLLASTIAVTGSSFLPPPLLAQNSSPAQPTMPGVKFTKVEDLDPNKKGPNRPIKQKWAVVIGLSDFAENRLNEKEPVMAKSAEKFRDYLIDEHGGRFNEKHVRLLVDSKATRGNIVDTVGKNWLAPLARPDDLVVVYISTASFPTTDGSAYLCTHDAALDNIYGTCFSIQDLMTVLKDNVKAERILLVLQCPYSGAVQLGSKSMERGLAASPEKSITGSGFIVVSSSQSDQLSWGDIFSSHFIKSLKEKDGMASLGEAFEEAKKKTEYDTTQVRKDLALQSPIMKTDWKGKELIIGAPAVEQASDIPANVQDFLAAEAHYFRANDGFAKGNLDEAIVHYEKAIAADPEYADALADFATVLFLKGDPNRSAELYLKAIDQRPEDSLYRTNYARVLSRLGKGDESRAQLEKAYQLNPKDRVALTALANLSLQNKETDKAIQLLKTGLETYPQSSDLHNQLSLAFARTGGLTEAVDHAQKAVSLDPNSVSARLNLGSMSLAQGKVDEAVAVYKEALKLQPSNPDAHFLLAKTFEKAGDLTNARTELKAFIEFAKPDDPRRSQAAQKLEKM